MENILAKLAQRFDTLMHANDSIVSETKPIVISNIKTVAANQETIAANKALFAEIFGEEAPEWWGQFGLVKH